MMHLVVFLKSPGLGEVGRVRASMCDCAARLGTLISRSLGILMLHRITGSGGMWCP